MPNPSNQSLVSGMKALLVDDDMILQLALFNQLQMVGFEVTQVSDGNPAIEQISMAEQIGAPFKLAFFDTRMPTLNGPDAVKKLQRLQVLDEITTLPCIIAMVESQDCNQARQFANLGITDVIVKPVMFPHILDIIQKYKLDQTSPWS